MIQPTAKLRKVSWNNLPLGSIILEWPQIAGASIPELASYPLITRELRAQLTERYQFLQGTNVTIADPEASLESLQVQNLARTALQLKDALPFLSRLKKDYRKKWLTQPDVREGLLSLNHWESSRFTLVKNWMRSLSQVVRTDENFGASVWDSALTAPQANESTSAILARLLSGQIAAPRAGDSLVDVGIDVSYSMIDSGKAHFAFQHFLEMIPVLAKKLSCSTWRVWLLSDTAIPLDWQYLATQEMPLENLLKKHRLEPEGTQFAPFYREVSRAKKSNGKEWENHLCILITDGVCQDQAQALRLAEKMAHQGIEYVQLVLHRDQEYREGIITDSPFAGKDGILSDQELKKGDVKFTRSDEELEDFCQKQLRLITDIAEAARGGQLVLTWYPLFSVVSFDLYEQYLGKFLV